MIYSTELASKIVITDSNKNSKFLEAGIHDNVKFTGARAATSPTGKNFMELVLKKTEKNCYILNGNRTLNLKRLKNRVRVRLLIR